MNKIKLSIIIPNFNTKKLILECLNSIYLNKPKTNFEIIVVDNGSTDGSIEILKKNKNIKLIQNNKNLGFSKACNIGIKSAKGKYILLLNSDTLMIKSSIDNLLDYAQKNKNVGAVSPKLINSDGSLQKSIFHFPTILNVIKEFWLKQKDSYNKYAPNGNYPVKVDVAVMTAFLITPLGLKKAGLLNEKCFMYFEDFDYCRKLHSNGLEVVYLPIATVIHHHGASGKKLANSEDQWRRLIPSSIIYHGLVKHYIINAIIWSRQQWQKVLNILKK